MYDCAVVLMFYVASGLVMGGWYGVRSGEILSSYKTAVTCDSGSDAVLLYLGRCSCVLAPSVWFNFRCPDQGQHIATVIHLDLSHNWHPDQCQELWCGSSQSATSCVSNDHLCHISVENQDAVIRVSYMSALDFKGHEDCICTRWYFH